MLSEQFRWNCLENVNLNIFKETCLNIAYKYPFKILSILILFGFNLRRVCVHLQLRTCTRAWMTGRSVRCLKARTGSTWRSNSCTGSSLWSWTSSADTSLSSPTRPPKRGRPLSRGRWACVQDLYLDLKGPLDDPLEQIINTLLYFSFSLMPPVNNSWALS